MGIRKAGAVAAAVVAASAVLAACSSPANTSTTTTRPASAGPVWLCRPGLAANPCTASLTATVAPGPHPTSSTTVQAPAPATNRAIDCFYVYPTVSTQPSTNADLNIEPAETVIAEAEASPFSPNCRIYAPMYRQLTSATISAAISGKPGVINVSAASVELAYRDVLAAWEYYLANYNDGRGVVFIGDSQGSAMLIKLLRSQVDPSQAERRLLVSAIILGGNVEVLSGQSVGGDFQNIPACNSTSATGCVVAYSSANQTPPSDSFFGRAGTGLSLVSGQPSGASSSFQVLCVNPTSLSSPSTPGMLQPYFPTAAFPTSVPSGSSQKPSTNQPTPWVTYPNMYTAHCENRNGASWLQVDDVARSGDTRPVVTEVPGPTWGLHLWDLNLALGNLVTLVHDEGTAYAAQSIGSGTAS
ncbi:MAG TPA: DUF3089 domain-containing protein [Acidimicrobiales bacterium]|nr:DUF3089 domain-containing protein [Acidimicrobiales bacterium]